IREAAAELGSRPGARGFANVDDLRARIVGTEVSEDEFRAVLLSMRTRQDVTVVGGYHGRAGLYAPSPKLQAARAAVLPDSIRIEGGYRPVKLVPSKAAKAAAKKAAPTKAAKAAKATAPKPVAERPLPALKKTVTDAGITIPTGAPRGVVENLVHNLEQGMAPATARATAVRELGELRGMVGDKLAQVSAALENDASERAMGFYAKQLERLSSGEG